MEVGVRKVMGVTSKGLIFQFLGESFLIVLLSMLVSLLIADLSLPLFNSLIDGQILFNWGTLESVLPYLGGALLFTVFASGFYPAFYLSSFKPASVLKGRRNEMGHAALMRKVLVTLQFVISIVLICSIVIISDQVSYIQNRDMGFSSNSKLVLPLRTEEAQQGSIGRIVKRHFFAWSTLRKVVTWPRRPIIRIV